MASRAVVSLLRQRALIARGSTTGAILRGGGHGAKMQPPFVQGLAPQASLPENDDLIWDDAVAPEPALDFDASNVSRGKGFAMFLGGLAFFALFGLLVKLTNPEGMRQAAPRTMPDLGFELQTCRTLLQDGAAEEAE